MEGRILDRQYFVRALNENLFSKIRRVHFKDGTILLEFSIKDKDTAYGDQFIWLLFSENSLELIEKIIEQVVKLSDEWSGKNVYVDLDKNEGILNNPIFRIYFLSDGAVEMRSFTANVFNIGKAHFGLFLGQGSKIKDEDAIIVAPMLAVALLNDKIDSKLIEKAFRETKKLSEKLNSKN